MARRAGPAGAGLPTPDLIDATPLALDDAGGKLALVASNTPVPCNGQPTDCSSAALQPIVDLVGWGLSWSRSSSSSRCDHVAGWRALVHDHCLIGAL